MMGRPNLVAEPVPYARLGTDILILRYVPDPLGILREYSSPAYIELMTVEACIPRYEDLFRQLDSSGDSRRLKPKALIYELYCLCLEENPHLKGRQCDREMAPTLH